MDKGGPTLRAKAQAWAIWSARLEQHCQTQPQIKRDLRSLTFRFFKKQQVFWKINPTCPPKWNSKGLPKYSLLRHFTAPLLILNRHYPRTRSWAVHLTQPAAICGSGRSLWTPHRAQLDDHSRMARGLNEERGEMVDGSIAQQEQSHLKV